MLLLQTRNIRWNDWITDWRSDYLIHFATLNEIEYILKIHLSSKVSWWRRCDYYYNFFCEYMHLHLAWCMRWYSRNPRKEHASVLAIPYPIHAPCYYYYYYYSCCDIESKWHLSIPVTFLVQYTCINVNMLWSRIFLFICVRIYNVLYEVKYK